MVTIARIVCMFGRWFHTRTTTLTNATANRSLADNCGDVRCRAVLLSFLLKCFLFY